MMEFVCKTVEDTTSLGHVLGQALKGGEVIVFHSDLGGGKTTFVKGLAEGMGVRDVVQSPTFVISQIHTAAHGLELHHFDFYRLNEAGVMRAELAESLADRRVIIAIEWGDIVHDIVPKDCVVITLRSRKEGEARDITIDCPSKYSYILNTLQNYQQNRAHP